MSQIIVALLHFIDHQSPPPFTKKFPYFLYNQSLLCITDELHILSALNMFTENIGVASIFMLTLSQPSFILTHSHTEHPMVVLIKKEVI